MSELKKLTVSGAKWVMAVTLIQRVMSFGTTIILARILEPADFGLFALAFVMIEGLNVLKSLGVDSALVRMKGDIQKAANTAFFLIPTTGFILFIILFFLAPIGARFLGNPFIGNIVRALGIIFVVSCFGKVPQTILYRDMKFNYRSIAELSAKTVYIIVVIVLALNKFGVWSLVAAYILQNIIQVSLEWYFSGWRPSFEFDKEIAWEMLNFGKFLLGSSIIVFIFTNSDNFLIGKLLGVTMLGYYAFARAISNYLNEYIFSRLGVIMLPAYSKIQDDDGYIRNVVVKVLKYIGMLSIPFCCFLLLFSSELLYVFFGNKWLPASNVLKVLTFVGLLNSADAALWPIFLAKGQSKTDFKLNVLQVGVFLLIVIPLTIKFSMMGTGFALLISSTLSFLVGILRLNKLIGLSFLAIYNSFHNSIMASLLMLIVGVFLKMYLVNINVYLGLVSKILLSGFVYVSIIYFQDKRIFHNIFNEIFSKRPEAVTS
jgi:O-antigen/teichoic acid export membrane protein